MIRVAICDDDISFTGSIEEQLHTLTSSLSIPLETETFFNGNSLFYLPPLNNLLINSQVTPLSSIFSLPFSDVICQKLKKSRSKTVHFRLDFCSFFSFKPQYLVVIQPYFPLSPQYVIIITVSTCVSLSKLISISSSIIGSLNLMDLSHCPLGWRSS